MAQYSIPYYFDEEKCAETGDPLPLDVFDFLPRSMDFLHGDCDQSAPLGESADLARSLRAFQAHAAGLLRDAASSEGTKEGTQHHDGNSVPSLSPIDSTGGNASGRTREERGAVQVRLVKIPLASHTDPFVDELLCGKACVVEFCQRPASAVKPKRTQRQQDDVSEEEGVEEEHLVLPLTVTAASRPILLRMARYVCPF
jgi:hypothetical protein